MKKRDRRTLNEYVRWCANELGLRDWTIRVDVGEPDSDFDRHDAEVVSATIQCVRGRKVAVMTVPESIRKTKRDEVRQTIAHELVHCHLNPLWSSCLNLLELAGKTVEAAMLHGVEVDLELAVDAIATEWARHLPLISW